MKKNGVSRDPNLTTSSTELALKNLGQIAETSYANGLASKIESDIVSLNYAKAFAAYSEEEQKEILALADSIDPTQIEKVMHYGAEPLKAVFNQCGDFLKSERGSSADQAVIAKVVELSQKAADCYEEFNLVLKEPNIFQKFLIKLLGEKNRTDKIQSSAINSYQLLMELRNYGESSLESLKAANTEICNSAMSDIESGRLLEKYIIAGKIAEQRLQKEVQAKLSNYELTGSQQALYEYKNYKSGTAAFVIRLDVLERQHLTMQVGLYQLSLIKEGNTNTQMAINTQMDSSMTQMAYQLRNAVLNEKTKQAQDGYKRISILNDELFKTVAHEISKATKGSVDLLCRGAESIESVKVAISIVKEASDNMRDAVTKSIPEMKKATEELKTLLDDLAKDENAFLMTESDSAISTNSTKGSEKRNRLNF